MRSFPEKIEAESITAKMWKSSYGILLQLCKYQTVNIDWKYSILNGSKTVQTEWKEKPCYFFPEVQPVFIQSITFYYPIMDSLLSLY